MPEHYLGVGSGDWVQQKIDRGRILILEDGSIWEVFSTDIKDSARWSLLSEITLIKETPHYYRLTNTNDGESISARFLGQR